MHKMLSLPFLFAVAINAVAQTCDLRDVQWSVQCSVTGQTNGPSGRPCFGAISGHSTDGAVAHLECPQTGAAFDLAAFSDLNGEDNPDGLCPLLITGLADRHLLEIPAPGNWQWTFIGNGMSFADWNAAASPEEAADMILRKWWSPRFWQDYRAETYGIDWKPPYDDGGFNQWYRTGKPGRFQVFFIQRSTGAMAGKTWASVRCGNRKGQSDHGNSLHQTHVDASAGPCEDFEQEQSPTIDFDSVQYGTQDNDDDSRRALLSKDGGFLSSTDGFLASIAGGEGQPASIHCEVLGP